MTTVINKRCKATEWFRDPEDREAGNKTNSPVWMAYI